MFTTFEIGKETSFLKAQESSFNTSIIVNDSLPIHCKPISYR